MFHELVAQELEKMKKEDILEPEYEMDSVKDHLLGDMSEGLRKLFTLWRRTGKAARALAKTAEASAKELIADFPEDEPTEADLKEIQLKLRALEAPLSALRDKEEALRNVFWLSVREEFPIADGKSLAICKGFKVAWFEEDKKDRSPIIGAIVIPIP